MFSTDEFFLKKEENSNGVFLVVVINFDEVLKILLRKVVGIKEFFDRNVSETVVKCVSISLGVMCRMKVISLELKPSDCVYLSTFDIS